MLCLLPSPTITYTVYVIIRAYLIKHTFVYTQYIDITCMLTTILLKALICNFCAWNGYIYDILWYDAHVWSNSNLCGKISEPQFENIIPHCFSLHYEVRSKLQSGLCGHGPSRTACRSREVCSQVSSATGQGIVASWKQYSHEISRFDVSRGRPLRML